MATRKEGVVLEREWKRGPGYALRVRAYGERHYLTLGYERDGWDWAKAETELENILADVRRGLWVPPKKKKKRRAAAAASDSAPGEVPLFGPFAKTLTKERKGQVAEKTTGHEKWANGHLIPFFGDWPLIEINAEGIDSFRAFKVRESEARARAIKRGKPKRNEYGQILKPLSGGSINRLIDHLQWVLSIAIEYKRFGIEENEAEGKRRRLPAGSPAPVYIDSAAQIEALLEAAAEMDRDSHWELCEREVIVATFVFAGPRAHELCNLLWRDVDLAGGRIFIGRSKTHAGLREIEMQPILRDILAAYKAISYRGNPDDLVFPSQRGSRRTPDNLLSKVLSPVFERTDEVLESRGRVPLPRKLTTHKLRHAFASVLIALGVDPLSVMSQIGHADATFTLRVYAHMMSRRVEDRERLRGLARGERVIARQAPPPKAINLGEYEAPILGALAERGGRAPRRDILAAVRESMAERHGRADLEVLASGEPRWQPRLNKARQRLVKRGWLERNARCGDWELTDRGWANAGSRARRRTAAARGIAAASEREPEQVAA